MTARELLTGSAFALTSASEVTSVTLGADYTAGRWPGGLMVKHSLGEGSYAGDGGSGTVESALTGVYPYAAVDLSERLRA